MRKGGKSAGLWLSAGLGVLAIVYGIVIHPSSSPEDKLVSPSSTLAEQERLSQSTAARGAAQKRAVSESKWGKSLRLGDPLYGAASVEEIVWLRRNGYPSMEQRQRVAQHVPVDDDLSALAPGDAAGILISEQLLLLDQDNAVAGKYLMDSAVEGSIYALEALARIGTSGGEDPDLASKAYYKAASMRGNWAVDVAGVGLLQGERSQMISSLGAQQILSNLDEQRARLGRDPLVRDTRPGLMEFNQKIRNATQGGDLK